MHSIMYSVYLPSMAHTSERGAFIHFLTNEFLRENRSQDDAPRLSYGYMIKADYYF